jgi:hypothetical protein
VKQFNGTGAIIDYINGTGCRPLQSNLAQGSGGLIEGLSTYINVTNDQTSLELYAVRKLPVALLTCAHISLGTFVQSLVLSPWTREDGVMFDGALTSS